MSRKRTNAQKELSCTIAVSLPLAEAPGIGAPKR